MDLVDIFINKIRLQVDKKSFITIVQTQYKYRDNNYSKVWGR